MELQQGHLIPFLTCRRLKGALTEDVGRQPGDPLLNAISLELAQIVKAQGRLDEARQLCEGLSSQYSVRPPCLVCPPVSHAPALVLRHVPFLVYSSTEHELSGAREHREGARAPGQARQPIGEFSSD